MKRNHLQAGLMAAGLMTASAAAPQNERLTTRSDQHEVAVTIYNENLALVKDSRKVKLDKGPNQLAWREVSAQMRPETALLRNLANPGATRLIEQNFDFDLLTPQKLLEKYIGRDVTVISVNPATGVEKRETASVLATNGGVVLKFADRIETGVPGRLAFSGVPDNLRDKPTLDGLVNSAAIFSGATVQETSLADWDAHLAINLTAPFLLTQAFGRLLGSELPGRVVNLLDWRATQLGTDHFAYTV